MRILVLGAALVLLAGCAGHFDLVDHHGLDAPAAGSLIPAPHGAWIEGPSVGGLAPPARARTP